MSTRLSKNLLNETQQISHRGRSSKYRTQISVISEILDVIKDAGQKGMIISTIARIVNLSHYAAVEKCETLAKSGLLEQIMRGRIRIFRITRSGLEFIFQFHKFKETADQISLKL